MRYVRIAVFKKELASAILRFVKVHPHPFGIVGNGLKIDIHNVSNRVRLALLSQPFPDTPENVTCVGPLWGTLNPCVWVAKEICSLSHCTMFNRDSGSYPVVRRHDP